VLVPQLPSTVDERGREMTRDRSYPWPPLGSVRRVPFEPTRAAAVLWCILAASVLACAPVASTRVRAQDSTRLPPRLAVLPFVDRTGELDQEELGSLRSGFAESLRSSGRFESVVAATSADTGEAGGVVEVAITQIDLGARRVAAVATVSRPDGAQIMKLSSHGDMVSVVWPLDYLGAATVLTKATIDDIAAELAKR
jgi:hypothetical protein